MVWEREGEDAEDVFRKEGRQLNQEWSDSGKWES